MAGLIRTHCSLFTEREVVYSWYPWCGRRVFVHEVTVKGHVRIFRCAATPDSAGRRLEIPDWMFERAACCGLRHAESPQADRAALEGLKSLIASAAAAL